MNIKNSIESELNLTTELNQLDESEKRKIIQVIERDAFLRKQHVQRDRLNKLRQEIELLEADSVDIPLEHVKTANFCARCKQSFAHGFGYFYYSLLGQAELCAKCNYKVCQQCRVNLTENKENFKWVCKLCHKYMEYKQLLLISGDWIQDEKIVRNKNRTKSKSLSLLSASQIVEITLNPKKANEINEQVNNNQNKIFKSYSELKNEKLRSQPSISSSKYVKGINNKRKETIKDVEKQTVNFIKAYQENETGEISQTNFETGKPVFRKQESSTRSVQERSKHFLSNIPIDKKIDSDPPVTLTQATGDPAVQSIQKSTNSLKTFREGANLKNETVTNKYKSLNFEAQLLNTKSNLKPIGRNITKEDDFNSVTSSNLSSRSDMENMNSINDFIIDNQDKINENKNAEQYSTSLFNVNSSKLKESKKTQSNLSINSTNSKNDEDMDNYFAKPDERNIDAINSENEFEISKKKGAIKLMQNGLSSPNLTENPSNSIRKETVTDEQIKSKSLKYHNTFRSLSRTISHLSGNEDKSKSLQFREKPKISLKIDYDRKSSNLIVKIAKCKNLKGPKNEVFDPYVKMYLALKDDDDQSKNEKLTEKDKKNYKRKTITIRNSSDPVFDQYFRYILAYDDLKNHKLKVSVCHNDKFGRNKTIGEINLPLKPDDFNSQNTEERWYDLEIHYKV